MEHTFEIWAPTGEKPANPLRYVAKNEKAAVKALLDEHGYRLFTNSEHNEVAVQAEGADIVSYYQLQRTVAYDLHRSGDSRDGK